MSNHGDSGSPELPGRASHGSPRHSGHDSSVVIVNYNGGEFISGCLDAVFAQSIAPLEVIVVDNNSTDGSAEHIASHYPEVTLLRSGSNLGFAGGCNLGVAAARGKWIVLLNPDTRPRREWLASLTDAASSSPPGDLVTSVVITRGVQSTVLESEVRLTILGHLVRCIDRTGDFAFAAAGAAMCFEKTYYPVPFPEDYFLYHEDVFLSWRARLLGRRVHLVRRSVVEHLGSAITSRVPALVSYHQEKNRLANCLVFYDDRTFALLSPLLFLDLLTHLFLHPTATRRALVWVLWNAPRLKTLHRSVQGSRLATDSELMQDFTVSLVQAQGPAREVATLLAASYCRLLRLPFLESQPRSRPELADGGSTN